MTGLICQAAPNGGLAASTLQRVRKIANGLTGQGRPKPLSQFTLEVNPLSRGTDTFRHWEQQNIHALWNNKGFMENR
jgi:hypothetical protein